MASSEILSILVIIRLIGEALEALAKLMAINNGVTDEQLAKFRADREAAVKLVEETE